MCANYEAPRQPELHFSMHPPPFEYLNELYPAMFGPILLQHPQHPDELQAVRAMFGMVPHWANLSLARQTYNARSETVAQKPTFRDAWRKRRFCLIPVDHFYEPCYKTGKAVRWSIHRKDGKPFALAGIWEVCQSKDPDKDPMPLRSFSMLTINATDHPLMKRFHRPEDEKRSVVVIEPEDYFSWLNAEDDRQARAYLSLMSVEEFTASPAPKVRAASATPKKRAAPKAKTPPQPPVDDDQAGELFE